MRSAPWRRRPPPARRCSRRRSSWRSGTPPPCDARRCASRAGPPRARTRGWVGGALPPPRCLLHLLGRTPERPPPLGPPPQEKLPRDWLGAPRPASLAGGWTWNRSCCSGETPARPPPPCPHPPLRQWQRRHRTPWTQRPSQQRRPPLPPPPLPPPLPRRLPMTSCPVPAWSCRSAAVRSRDRATSPPSRSYGRAGRHRRRLHLHSPPPLRRRRGSRRAARASQAPSRAQRSSALASGAWHRRASRAPPASAPHWRPPWRLDPARAFPAPRTPPALRSSPPRHAPSGFPWRRGRRPPRRSKRR